VTRDVPPGKLAVGMPARMRDPRPTAEEPAATAPEPPSPPRPGDATG
jgi:serine acetyltransferase